MQINCDKWRLFMSAIYGAINLNKSTIDNSIQSIFENDYAKYKIDRFEHFSCENMYLGCGIQNFTQEAEAEEGPIIDDDNGLIFVADCILTHREKLMEELSTSFKISPSTPDGTLLYYSFLKWNTKCTDHIRGHFSFVVYNRNDNTVLLYTDHFSLRCLFYHLRDNVLYFSTLMFPLLHASGLSFSENKRWLIDCLSLNSPVMVTNTIETPVSDVYKIECGSYVSVRNNTIKRYTYYAPEKTIKVNKKISDQDVKAKLHKTLSESISLIERINGKVGIKLSSGLDSTSIAGFAAPILAKKGETLYSYTSVPLKNAIYNVDRLSVPDETNGVLDFCKLHSNIKPKFVDCQGKNIMSELDKILDTWELPSKSQQNAVWTTEINRIASEEGCRIILSGSTGNCTLSAGYFDTYWLYLLTHFHPIKSINELKTFCNYNRLNAKALLKHFVKSIVDYYFAMLTFKSLSPQPESLVNETLIVETKQGKRFKKLFYSGFPIRTWKRLHNNIYYRLSHAQISEIGTKSSLTYGVLQYDPLCDVDFINLCSSLPVWCFSNNRYDRRLVRDYLDDIVPDSIRLEVKMRGVQSADNSYRVKEAYNEYKLEVESTVCSDEYSQYIDQDAVVGLINRIDQADLLECENDVRLLMNAFSFCKYVKKLREFN